LSQLLSLVCNKLTDAREVVEELANIVDIKYKLLKTFKNLLLHISSNGFIFRI
jgi:hypothetical protein